MCDLTDSNGGRNIWMQATVRSVAWDRWANSMLVEPLNS